MTALMISLGVFEMDLLALGYNLMIKDELS